LVRLRDLFRVPGKPGRRQNIIVVRYAGCKAGLIVDDLLGEHQTVIKPLNGIFSHLKGLSGSTILGSGQVALILDVQALISQISLREQASLSSQGLRFNQPRRGLTQGIESNEPVQ
jgi:two-component system chemotaxis sensor kinase CheA